MLPLRVLWMCLLAFRSLQICCSLTIVSVFAYLIGIIVNGRLGLTTRMVSVEIMVCSPPLATSHFDLLLFRRLFYLHPVCLSINSIQVQYLSNLLNLCPILNPTSQDQLTRSTLVPQPSGLHCSRPSLRRSLHRNPNCSLRREPSIQLLRAHPPELGF